MGNHEEATTTASPITTKVTPVAKKALLILSCILLAIGNCGGPLIMRLYFIHGGNRVWLSSFLETAGWPFILVVFIILYFRRLRDAGKDGSNKRTTFIYMRPRLFFAVAFIGVLTGLDDYLYAYGVARLPISTSALILAPHLAFVAVFAYLLVKQKFTPYSINAVVLLTVGAAVLALHTSNDRPEGESKKEYAMGFVMTVAAALLYGFVLPLIELTYKKANQAITYTLVVEIQIIMCLFATIFCTIGMIANNDFKQNKPIITGTTTSRREKVIPAAKKNLLILNCILLSIGNCGGPLILRLYFIHGGHRIWLIGFIETVGWPLIFIILVILYIHRRFALRNNHNNHSTTFIYMRRRLFMAVALIGVLTGLDDYLYSFGVGHLPVSTYALINATRLVFMAVFAFILVKQKFTPYSVNAVVLLTLGSAMLAFHANGDRPAGETTGEYVMGFLLTVAAAALYGLVSPLVELTYKKAKQEITYSLVLEVQMVMCLFATVFCMVGMIFNDDFKVISRESEDFGLGKMKYILILSVSVILWQCFFLGAIGVIHYGSSLLLGVIAAVQIPVMQILAVIFYKEKFESEKGFALVLSLWGFLSFFYGEYRNMKMMKGTNTQSSSEIV